MKIVTTAFVLGLMSTTAIAGEVSPKTVENVDSITLVCSDDVEMGTVLLSDPPQLNCGDMETVNNVVGLGITVGPNTRINAITSAINRYGRTHFPSNDMVDKPKSDVVDKPKSEMVDEAGPRCVNRPCETQDSPFGKVIPNKPKSKYNQYYSRRELLRRELLRRERALDHFVNRFPEVQEDWDKQEWRDITNKRNSRREDEANEIIREENGRQREDEANEIIREENGRQSYLFDPILRFK